MTATLIPCQVHLVSMAPSNDSSAYSYRPGGSLKFKGEGSSSHGRSSSSSSAGRSKKKSSKSRSSSSRDIRSGTGSKVGEREHKRLTYRDERHDLGEGKGNDEEALQDGETSTSLYPDDDEIERQLGRPMTASERKFEEAQRKRMAARVAKQARMSHKEKVDQFNKSLAERSEHNDMLTISGH